MNYKTVACNCIKRCVPMKWNHWSHVPMIILSTCGRVIRINAFKGWPVIRMWWMMWNSLRTRNSLFRHPLINQCVSGERMMVISWTGFWVMYRLCTRLPGQWIPVSLWVAVKIQHWRVSEWDFRFPICFHSSTLYPFLFSSLECTNEKITWRAARTCRWSVCRRLGTGWFSCGFRW